MNFCEEPWFLEIINMIKIFMGGERGGRLGGGSSEGCLKWGGGGSLSDLSKTS